jgi:hypothetical protein
MCYDISTYKYNQMKLKFANLKFQEMIKVVIFFMTFSCDEFEKKNSSIFLPRRNLRTVKITKKMKTQDNVFSFISRFLQRII